MLKFNPTNSSKTSRVEVVPYDDRWPEMFAQEAAKIQAALGDNCVTIHHVGSTSVPGLCAKPIIDMVPVVKDILKIEGSKLESLGYEARGELGMLFRRYFSNHTSHVHVWEQGNEEIDKHLIFRDYIIKNPGELKRYEALKLSLAEAFPTDRTSYTFSKDDLIRELLQKAGFQGTGMVQALTNREWGAVKSLRQRYVFDSLDIQDPYGWTFDDPNHYHVVLLKGCATVGYAHLQFWPDNRAILRAFLLEELWGNTGLKEQFLKDLERWLTHQNIARLHAQSISEENLFYKQAGYEEMPFQESEGWAKIPQARFWGKIL